MKLNLAGLSILLFIIFIFGSTFFIYGFLPLSYTNEKKSDYKDLPKFLDDIPLNHSLYKTKISRLIIMVIDAFRIDFVPQMKFLNKLLADNKSCNFNIKVQSPTVTMPRIKALTSGTVPNFVDIILNLGSSELKSDSILHQIYDKGGKMVFCGDNTWVKMFPEMFYRKLENHDSFFVNDFYEGDRNITQRLNLELRSPIDWKLLILHYLGLDHIGHVEGPYSTKVPIKLQEMDNVVSKIYSSMDLWYDELPSLYLITGDHGMRDSGGHGGSTYAEMNVPLIVTGIKCESNVESYHQIDIAPTISVLFGLPIPASSIGTIIPELLNSLTNIEQLYALHYNGERLITKLSTTVDINAFKSSEFYIQYNEAKKYHKKYLQSINDHNTKVDDVVYFKKSKLLYLSSSRKISDQLITYLIKYDEISIMMGLILMSSTSIVIILHLIATNKYQKDININLNLFNFWPWVATQTLIIKFLLSKLEVFQSTWFNRFLYSDVICLIFVNLLFINYYIAKDILNYTDFRDILKSIPIIIWFLIFGILFQTLSLCSSSYVEEEHQTWYYLMSTLIILIFLKDLRHNLKNFLNIKNYKFLLNWFIICSLNIILKRLNQTGDKWIHLNDFGDWLIRVEHKIWLSLFVLIGLFGIIIVCCKFNNFLTIILTFTGTILIYHYHTITGSILCPGITLSEPKTTLIIFWCNVLEIILINYVPFLFKYYAKRKINNEDIKSILSINITIFCIISALLHKPHNIILNVSIILYCNFLNGILKKLFTKHMWLFITIVSHFWIGKLFYFYQGNSNNLSTIDLNAGYIGLDHFNFLIVGLFVTINTYNAVILSFLVLIYNLYDGDTVANNNNVDNDDANNICISNNNIQIIFPHYIFLIVIPFNFYCYILLFFRYHLFIWTVFSPKLLYEFFHLCLVFLILCFTFLFIKFFRIKSK